MAESEIQPTQTTPSQPTQFSNVAGIKPATPDLIIFDESILPVDIMADLLFEQVGGQEIINIARHDLLNGQRKGYNLISNTDRIATEYGSKNFIRIPGTINEKFDNFGIKFENRVPANGTGPAAYYVGAEGTNGCTDFPVLDRYDDTLIGCYATYGEAQNAIDNTLAPQRPIVYSDTSSGDIVVDVTRMRNNELVDIEVLAAGTLENDTIY